jgi:hypothetical protein
MIPVSIFFDNADFGQDLTHVGSSHKQQAIDILKVGSILILRMRDNKGLNPFSLINEHTRPQIRHPTHLSGSETMNLQCIKQ